MDTRWLEDALILLEEGSMRAAAERRNVTQPAFSRRIQALEAWMGETLVVRHANRVDITDTLRACEPELRSLLKSLQNFQTQRSNVTSPFVVASQHSLSISVFPEIYKSLVFECHVTPIRLRNRNQDENITLFLKHEVDMLLSYEANGTPRLPFDSTVLHKIWRRDTMLPVVGGGLRYQLNDRMEPIVHMPTLMYPEGSDFRQIFDAHLGESVQDIVQETHLVTAFAAAATQMVKMGAGIAWVPQSLVREDIISGQIVPLSHDFGRIPLDVVLSVHSGNKRAVETLERLTTRL